MIWRRWRRNAQPPDREGKELAKRQYAVSEVMVESARELAAEHRAIQQANHFGATVAAALKGHR